jgi:hypothetical protein
MYRKSPTKKHRAMQGVRMGDRSSRRLLDEAILGSRDQIKTVAEALGRDISLQKVPLPRIPYRSYDDRYRYGDCYSVYMAAEEVPWPEVTWKVWGAPPREETWNLCLPCNVTVYYIPT